MKISKWSICFAIALFGLTTYMILDTFVIPETYTEEAAQVNASNSQSLAVIEEEDEQYVMAEEKISEAESETKVKETEESEAVSGAAYERFSHRVYSFYMVYAFLVPLLFSVVPNTLWILFGKKDIPEASRYLWNYGIATITVGCMLKGVLEIYGTTNRHLIVYPIIAGMLIIAAVIVGLIKRFGMNRVTGQVGQE